MLRLPDYSETSVEVQIFQQILRHPQTDYFIAVDFSQKGEQFPSHLADFISQKVLQKSTQAGCFRTVFKQDAWRLLLTFIPLNQTLEPKFHFVHKFVKLCQKCD